MATNAINALGKAGEFVAGPRAFNPFWAKRADSTIGQHEHLQLFTTVNSRLFQLSAMIFITEVAKREGARDNDRRMVFAPDLFLHHGGRRVGSIADPKLPWRVRQGAPALRRTARAPRAGDRRRIHIAQQYDACISPSSTMLEPIKSVH